MLFKRDYESLNLRPYLIFLAYALDSSVSTFDSFTNAFQYDC